MTNSLVKSQREQILSLIDSEQGIGIIIGDAHNIDNVAASLGLYLILKTEGKNVQVISKKEPTVEVSSLFGVDQISKSFDGNTKTLTISVPYREGEIEKVSYNIEGDRLNVNLFAEEAGISFKENDIKYIKKGAAPAVVIAIGIATEEELKEFVDAASVKMINIDSNPLNSLTGGISIVDSSFSSLSEIVAQMVMDLSLTYDVDAFQNLMDGITFATRNFTLPATSAFAFETAGFLMQNGAKRREKEQTKPGHDDRFPREEHLLNSQPRADRPLAEKAWQKGQGLSPVNPQNRPNTSQKQTGQGSGVKLPYVKPQSGFQSNNSGQNPSASQGQQSNSQQNPQKQSFNPQSAPKEMISEGDMPEEMPYTEGSIGSSEIPDDWFLPKVFKGSKKGN